MRKSRFTEEQIIAILKQRDVGKSIPELCSEHGISESTLYSWRTRFRLHSSVHSEHLEKLQNEIQRLRQQVFDLTLELETAKGKLRRNSWSIPESDWDARRAS